MKEIIVSVIAIICYGFLGAWCITGAIDSFKRHRYFAFGMELMIAIADAALMVKHIVA